jgi:hypothetical protein
VFNSWLLALILMALTPFQHFSRFVLFASLLSLISKAYPKRTGVVFALLVLASYFGEVASLLIFFSAYSDIDILSFWLCVFSFLAVAVTITLKYSLFIEDEENEARVSASWKEIFSITVFSR